MFKKFFLLSTFILSVALSASPKSSHYQNSELPFVFENKKSVPANSRKSISKYESAKNIKKHVNAQPRREDEQTYTVKCNVKYNSETHWINYMNFAVPYVNDGVDVAYCFDENEPLEFNLTQDTYDFIIILQGDDGLYLLTKDNVEIKSDLTLDFNIADATNLITFDVKIPSGNNMISPLYDIETGECIDKGNAEDIYAYTVIGHKKCGYIIFDYSDESRLKYSDGIIRSFVKNIHCTPTDKLYFNQTKSGLSTDGIFIVPFAATSKKSVSLSNNISQYTKFAPKFQKSNYDWNYEPDPELNLDITNARHYKYYEFTNDGIELGAFEVFSVLSILPNVIYYTPSVATEDANDISLTILPMLFSLEFPGDEDSDTGQIESIPIFADNGKMEYGLLPIRYGISADTDGRAHYGKGSDKFILPYSDDIVFGSTAPSVLFNTTPTEGFCFFNYYFVGRYGENRTIDSKSQQFTLKVNDELKCASYSDLDSFMSTWWESGMPQGRYDIDIVNENVTVDNIKAHCTAHISYDTKKEDMEAPSLRFIHFRNNEGKITDRFDKSENATLEFTAGDFHYVLDEETYMDHYTYKPLDKVKVEWAPNGTTDFTELTVEEVPELFCMPGFGAFYRGSLSSVNKMSSNGWFDLRITLTDAAGNYQEQVISPAFKVNALDAVSEVSTDGDIQVYVRDGAIVVSGVENPNIEVYNAAGSRVRTNGLTQGIYVVRVNGTAHKVFVK